ncbi:Nn.00g073950.m01.CDS01 [Neocucurbitaria sp. VM-36]
MAPSTLQTIVIDPNGDAIITLSKPGVSFAIWELKADEYSGHDIAKKKSKKMLKAERLRQRRIEEEEEAAAAAAAAALEAESNVVTNGLEEAPAAFGESIESQVETKGKSEEESSSRQPEQELTEISEPAVAYRVSSKHLATASGTFRSELSGLWNESTKGEDGLYHLTAEDWDPEVLTILLEILHLRNRKVPPSITLETMAKLAVLVDYYRCWEAVEMWTNVWIADIRRKEPVPRVYSRNLILWLLIAWVFELDAEFVQTTRIVLRQSQTPDIEAMGLPIPPVVIEAIELRRYQAIDAVISICYNWIEKLREDTYVCQEDIENSFACGSMLLGALTKHLHRLGWLLAKPEIPFAGHSFENICKTIKEVEAPFWSSEYTQRRYGNSSWHGCGLQSTTIGPEIDAVLKSTQGLNLHDFIDRAKEMGMSEKKE